MLKRIFALIIALGCSLAAQAPGTYAGMWTSGSSGSGGKLNLVFTDTGLSMASFTMTGGLEVKTKTISNRPEGSSLDFVFEYDIDGNLLRSRMQGTVDGKTIKGKYRSAPAGGGEAVDEGTWEVTQQ